MAGYSGTPLPTKLGIKPGSRVALLHAPDDFAAQLQPLPPDVRVRTDARVPADVVILFARDLESLAAALAEAMRALPAHGGLWLAWPKRASNVQTTLTEDEVRETGLATGLVDNKICAINETWSGLRFVVRVADRPTWHVR